MAKPTESELKLIQELKNKISDLELLSDEFLDPKNLIRFIRVKNGDVNAAEVMVRENVKFYESHDIEAVLTAEYPKDFYEFWPSYILAVDDDGGPIAHVPLGKWDSQAYSKNKEEYFLYNLKGFETVWGLQLKNSKGKDYIPGFSIIVDLEGLGWKQYRCYDGINGILRLLRLFESTYPETLKKAVIVNAPSIFGLFWKLVRPIFSEATQKRITVLGGDKTEWIKSISEFAKPNQFPKHYGGEVNDREQNIPVEEVAKFRNYVFRSKTLSKNG